MVTFLYLAIYHQGEEEIPSKKIKQLEEFPKKSTFPLNGCEES